MKSGTIHRISWVAVASSLFHFSLSRKQHTSVVLWSEILRRQLRKKMLRRTITGKLNIAAICQYFYFKSHANSSSVPSFHHSVSQTRHFLSNNSPNAESTSTTQGYENLTTLVDGCDYEHWLVLMKPPEGYPTRHQIVHNYYIGTLALALGRYSSVCFPREHDWLLLIEQLTIIKI